MFCTNCGKEIANGGSFCHNCGQQTTKKEESSANALNTESTTIKTFVPISQEEYEKRKSRNKKIGLLWLIGPAVTLVGVLLLYSIFNFVLFGASGGSASSSYLVVGQIIKVVLGLVGLVAVVCVMVGIPVGIIYLSKREEFAGMKFDPRSGKDNTSEIPSEINHWSWGAAGLTWIWGVYHRVWISFLVFIPIVNIVMIIYLGIKGNKLAWRADKWESVEKFLETEKKWKPWGIVFFALNILGIIGNLSGYGN